MFNLYYFINLSSFAIEREKRSIWNDENCIVVYRDALRVIYLNSNFRAISNVFVEYLM